MQIDFPCLCGHSRGCHQLKYFKGRMWADINTYEQEACYEFLDSIAGNLCKCMNYKADNLKYLESLVGKS